MKPSDLGLPAKYASFRPHQEDTIFKLAAAEERFIGLDPGTGAGKTTIGVGTMMLSGGRWLYLTVSKNLQNQLGKDHKGADSELADVRGMSNYQCVAIEDRYVPVVDGPCHGGFKCDLKFGGCPYYDAIRYARTQDRVSSNYAMWMTNLLAGGGRVDSSDPAAQTGGAGGIGLGSFDGIIMDEGHEIHNQLSDFLTVDISEEELHQIATTIDFPQHASRLKSPVTLDDWRVWGSSTGSACQLKIESTLQEIEGLGPSANSKTVRANSPSVRLRALVKDLRKLKRKLAAVAKLSGRWSWEWSRDSGTMNFSPIMPGAYAEQFLYDHTPKIIQMSATFRPQHMQFTGIGKGSANEGVDGTAAFWEYPPIIDPRRTPVFHLPTVGLRYNSSELDLRTWIDHHDQVIGQRLDRKGLILPVSYKRADQIKERSKYGNIILTHNKRTTRETIQRYLEAPAPVLLASPVVHTGLDFPYRDCEYIIWSKMPFVQGTSAVMQARKAEYPDYMDLLAAVTFRQGCGRGTRMDDDYCEVFVLDDNVVWFIRRAQKSGLVAKWFRIIKLDAGTIPKPPARVADKGPRHTGPGSIVLPDMDDLDKSSLTSAPNRGTLNNTGGGWHGRARAQFDRRPSHWKRRY